MFDPLALAAVLTVTASGTAGALVLGTVAAVTMYRPGPGKRRRVKRPE